MNETLSLAPTDRHPPLGDPLAERPYAVEYYSGTATLLTEKPLVKDEEKAMGWIKIVYFTPELAVLHRTAWILDANTAETPANWNDVSPTINGHNVLPQEVPAKPVQPGMHSIQFWAQTAWDVPPPVMKDVEVVGGAVTMIMVNYSPQGGTFPEVQTRDTGSVTVVGPTACGGAPGYGQLVAVRGNPYVSTSWSIDGGIWRSIPLTNPTPVVVYAGTRIIQFRVNVAGHTAPPTRAEPVYSTYLTTLKVSYN